MGHLLGIAVALAVLFVLNARVHPHDSMACTIYSSASADRMENSSPTVKLPEFTQVTLQDGQLVWMVQP